MGKGPPDMVRLVCSLPAATHQNINDGSNGLENRIIAMHRLPFQATPLSVGVSIEPPALVEDTCRNLIHIRFRPPSSCVSSSHLLLLVRSPPRKFRPCLLIANAWPHPFRTTRAASSTVDLSFDFVFSRVVSMCIHMRCVTRAGELGSAVFP